MHARLLLYCFLPGFHTVQKPPALPQDQHYTLQRLALQHPDLVDRFYRERQGSLFWFGAERKPIEPGNDMPGNDTAGKDRPGKGTPGENIPGKDMPGKSAWGRDSLRRELSYRIGYAAWQGLDSNRYHPQEIRRREAVYEGDAPTGNTRDSPEEQNADRMYTDAAITLCKDLYQGGGIGSLISYDGISPAYGEQEDRLLLDRLGRCANAEALAALVTSLEPVDRQYRVLRDSLAAALKSGDTRKQRRLAAAMNIGRWIRHRNFDRFIIVNIASTTLRYYSGDTLRLSMKIVAGQASKRTPRFAAWCGQVILYPYWNVPRKIAIRELLPVFKRLPASVTAMNMQILDGRGQVIDPSRLAWASYDKDHFPYSVRQSTGCDNALGVIKFNLTSPYDVYLHDTNFKMAFLSGYRYYSHGCIRLEKPMDLASELLRHTLDTGFLKSCLKDQQPVTLDLENRVPVFVVYLTAEADDSGAGIAWFKDVYHLEN
ncbi:MAG: L,D-transpeptidase family protein [Puia sp.]|nr:L,D-transpeptidase family protein [Puia sp.]